jgi:hypothetical protein
MVAVVIIGALVSESRKQHIEGGLLPDNRDESVGTRGVEMRSLWRRDSCGRPGCAEFGQPVCFVLFLFNYYYYFSLIFLFFLFFSFFLSFFSLSPPVLYLRSFPQQPNVPAASHLGSLRFLIILSCLYFYVTPAYHDHTGMISNETMCPPSSKQNIHCPRDSGCFATDFTPSGIYCDTPPPSRHDGLHNHECVIPGDQQPPSCAWGTDQCPSSLGGGCCPGNTTCAVVGCLRVLRATEGFFQNVATHQRSAINPPQAIESAETTRPSQESGFINHKDKLKSPSKNLSSPFCTAVATRDCTTSGVRAIVTEFKMGETAIVCSTGSYVLPRCLVLCQQRPGRGGLAVWSSGVVMPTIVGFLLV